MAEDALVGSLSNGACWFDDQEELLKVVSFNDKEVIQAPREDLLNLVLNNFSKKQNKVQSSLLSLHCGGYGHSLVMNINLDGVDSCVWLYSKNGTLEMRSVGGSLSSKNGLCHGYKWGSLIVGTTRDISESDLMNHETKDMIKNMTKISNHLYRIDVTEAFVKKESQVKMILETFKEIRYVEFNMIQHPVGEWVSLK